MDETSIIAPVQEPQVTEQATQQEQTIGEAIESSQATKEEVVPLSAFLEIKKENKALSREMKEIKKSIEEGASRSEVNADLSAIAEKHNVDADFLKDFAKAVRAEAKKETDEEINAKLKPMQEKERMEKINQAFQTHFDKAMESMPEYAGTVNKEVIKALSLMPQNSNKTFTKLIEESFGHLVAGKKSIESASSRVSKNDNTDVDVARANKDPEYFSEVMASPESKKKYVDATISNLMGYL